MKKGLFIIVNAILVAFIGVLVGVVCKDSVFRTDVTTISYALLLVTLCLPTLIMFVAAPQGLALLSITCVLMAAELIANISFMCIDSIGSTTLVIVQSILVGLYLITLLVIIGTKSKEAKE